jgi:hypothetical protein
MSVDWLKISNKGAGLTNQLFTFITGLILAKYKGCEKIVIDSFFIDAFRNENKPISQVFDLIECNNFFRSYNLEIVDIDALTVNVFYGINDRFIDITSVWPKILPAEYNINNLAGDPAPNVEKILYIQYKNDRGDVVISYVCPEQRQTDLHTPPIFTSLFAWIDTFDRKMFDNILRNITFNYSYRHLAELYLDELNITGATEVNVIHVRLENDIKHWSDINKMTEMEYRRSLENKYILSIVENFDKRSRILVLSYDYNNRVIEYLKNNGYNYYCPPKYSHLGREENAIVDFLIASKSCTNAFIGNFNISKLNGSTFSYLIYLYLKPGMKYIYIDIDKINDPAITEELR